MLLRAWPITAVVLGTVAITVSITATINCSRKQTSRAVLENILWIQFRLARASTAVRGGPAGETDLEENGDAEQWRRKHSRANRILQPPNPAGDARLATSRRGGRSHSHGLSPSLSRQDFSLLI